MSQQVKSVASTHAGHHDLSGRGSACFGRDHDRLGVSINCFLKVSERFLRVSDSNEANNIAGCQFGVVLKINQGLFELVLEKIALTSGQMGVWVLGERGDAQR
jgi:hypothetical protein